MIKAIIVGLLRLITLPVVLPIALIASLGDPDKGIDWLVRVWRIK